MTGWVRKVRKWLWNKFWEKLYPIVWVWRSQKSWFPCVGCLYNVTVYKTTYLNTLLSYNCIYRRISLQKFSFQQANFYPIFPESRNVKVTNNASFTSVFPFPRRVQWNVGYRCHCQKKPRKVCQWRWTTPAAGQHSASWNLPLVPQPAAPTDPSPSSYVMLCRFGFLLSWGL